MLKRSIILVCWESPPTGWSVLNIDGESKGNPESAGGVVFFMGTKESGNVDTWSPWVVAPP